MYICNITGKASCVRSLLEYVKYSTVAYYQTRLKEYKNGLSGCFFLNQVTRKDGKANPAYMMVHCHLAIMATGGTKVSSDIVEDLSEISDVVNDLNKENSDCLVATHIELTDKGKIQWNGPYEMLQKLMVKLTGEDVLWSTPGGDCKMLKLNEVEVRWYTSNKSLTINGIKKEYR